MLSVWPNSSPTFYPLRACVGCKVAILSSLKQHKLVQRYCAIKTLQSSNVCGEILHEHVGVLHMLMSCVPVATTQDTTRKCMYWWGVSLSKHPHIYILSAVVRQRTPACVRGFYICSHLSGLSFIPKSRMHIFKSQKQLEILHTSADKLSTVCTYVFVDHALMCLSLRQGR